MVTLTARLAPYGVTFVSDLIDLPGLIGSAESEQIVNLTGTTLAGVELATCLIQFTTTNSPNPGDKAVTLWNVEGLVLNGLGIPVAGVLTAYIEYIEDAANQPVTIVSTITGLSIDVLDFALATGSADPSIGQQIIRDQLSGNDLAQLSRFGDRVGSEAGQDVLYGYAGNDTLDGGGDADAIFGGKGSDQLSGGAGADRVKGGDNDDTLDGGTGDDILFGGLGADVFFFGTGSGRDRIVDFADGEDRIDFGPNLVFDDVKITQRGADTVVRLDDQLVILKGFDGSLLDASDFVLVFVD